MPATRLAGFALVWVALAVFTAGAIRSARASRVLAKPAPAAPLDAAATARERARERAPRSIRAMPRIPNPWNLLTLLALFVALGGTTYAAAKIGGADVRNGSLTGADIRNGSLSEKELSADRAAGARRPRRRRAKGDQGERARTAPAARPARRARRARRAPPRSTSRPTSCAAWTASRSSCRSTRS